MSPPRFLYIDLPHWSADLARRRHRRFDDATSAVRDSRFPAQTVLVFEEMHGRRRVRDACRGAVTRGVRCGMTLAEARAILVDRDGRHRVIEAAHEAWRDARSLHRLAVACQWVTPVVSEDSPCGLVLDLRGCDRVVDGLGGTSVVIDRLETDLHRRGIQCRIGGADTATLARAWSRHGVEVVGAEGFHQRRVIDTDADRALLDTLPVAALELESEVETALSAVRIRTLGDLRTIPRAAIPVRYGIRTLHRLDEAEGRRAEVLNPVVVEEPVEVAAGFSGPVHDPRAIEYRMAELVRDLAGRLRRRGLLALDMEIRVGRPRMDDWFETVRCASGARGTTALWSIIRPASARIPLDDGVDSIRILVAGARPASDRVGVFWDDCRGTVEEHGCDDLVDRVVARFGAGSVRRFSPRRTHVPEEQCRLVSEAVDSARSESPSWEPTSTLNRFLGRFGCDPRRRPTVTLESVEPVEVVQRHRRPEEVVWNRRRYRIHQAHGPESIGIPWWRESVDTCGTDARREYWRVVPVAGPWLWIFRRSSDGRWFVHGLWA